MDKKCSDCKEYCDEHKVVLEQLKDIKHIPTTVSKLSGTLAMLGLLIITAVGVIFNAHIESKKTTEVYANKIDALSTQISELNTTNIKSISTIKSDIIRINVTLEQIRKNTRDNRE